MSTRDRIIEQALRLFGEQGYSQVAVAKIEAAAGLSEGSGALYRHFRSKEELLVEAVRAVLSDWGPYAQFAEPEFSAAPLIDAETPSAPLADKLAALCHLGLIRADHIRDVTRILLRDNSVPTGVLDTFRAEDHDVLAALTERTLRDLAGEDDTTTDWRPTAEMLVGAISYLWLIRDIYGGDRPCGISIEDYITATAQAVAARIEQTRSRP